MRNFPKREPFQPARPLIPYLYRRWLYQITTAAVPLLIAYGVIDNQVAPLWVGLAASVLATGTAAAHTPREEGHRDSPTDLT